MAYRSTARFNVISEIVATLEREYAAVTRMASIDRDRQRPHADAEALAAERAEESAIIAEAQAQYTSGALFDRARQLGINKTDIRLLRNRFPLITDYWTWES